MLNSARLDVFTFTPVVFIIQHIRYISRTPLGVRVVIVLLLRLILRQIRYITSNMRSADQGPRPLPTSNMRSTDQGPQPLPTSNMRSADQGPQPLPTSNMRSADQGPQPLPTSNMRSVDQGPRARAYIQHEVNVQHVWSYWYTYTNDHSTYIFWK